MKNKKFASFLTMNAGCILLSVGVYFFKIPNGFTTGGVTGIGIVSGKIIPLTPAVLIRILNGFSSCCRVCVFGKTEQY